MKRLSLILLFAFFLISCKQNAQNIPNEIVNNEKNNFDIPGTRISVNKPTNFEFFPELSRIQKNDENKIQILEMTGADFTSYKLKFLQGIENATKNGGKIDYQKNLKLNGYDALILSAPQNKRNLSQTILLFGDNTFSVMLAGETPLGNELEKNEILKIILTTKYDKNKILNEEQFNQFSIDLKNSGFKFNKNVGGVSFYTINGSGSPFGDKLTDILMVQILPKMSKDEMVNYSEKIIEKMHNNSFPEKNIKTLNTDKRFYSENGNEVLEYLMNNSVQNQLFNNLLILKSTEKGTILYSVIDKTQEKTNILKDVFRSIKIK